MKDFFDDLERQLVAATPQRTARLRRARVRRTAAVASILVALLAGGAGIAAAVGGGGDPRGGHGTPVGRTAATTGDHFTRTTLTSTTAPADRGASEIAVLNGTTVPGLGRGVANRLQTDRFKIGNVTNAAAQDQRRTVVYFRTPDDIPAATEVASSLRLGDAGGEFSLRHAPRALTSLAGPGARVIVVVGSDQNAPSGP
ncbi:MAG TPA: LytR C-terminal domain-containing protein [Baekduia sp.]|uniref:LytR C-terminal domain-containing protein n=1 Tax=Baekduia sp. TaxID=2600305 RepID=UPI002D796289|nr:LytR C-terminal domain-containing protein [Baekduia sp.]HET6505459.1 LytR C-terminal domain-containing protein [Baekduia sp.]